MEIVLDAESLASVKEKPELNSLVDWPAAKLDGLIDKVYAGEYGVYASLGPNFQYAVFGRDSIEVAEDLLEIRPELAHTIILTLARLQGISSDLKTEEEPGKIHHEYRDRVMNGRVVPDESLDTLYGLQETWGGDGTDRLLYYGSFDATPLYVRLVGKYVELYGNEILSEEYSDKEGRQQTIDNSVRAALGWLSDKLASHPLGLLAFKQMNPEGLLNQVWKDSPTSYMLPDGTEPNYAEPIASVELQGYAYDALIYGVEMCPDDNQSLLWQRQAEWLRKQIRLFWMEDQGYFAQAMYQGAKLDFLQIETNTSNGALLLDSQILHDVPADDRLKYVHGIARTIMSADFLTDAGVRCRALKHVSVVPYADYHGSYTVWPKDTYDIIRGLNNHGRNHDAIEIGKRLLKTVAIAGDFYELFYVEQDGRVLYNAVEAVEHLEAKYPGVPVEQAEPGQAWTISAVIAMVHQIREHNHPELELVRSP